MTQEKFLSHIKVYLPCFNEFPVEKAQKWADAYYKQICHISGHRRKSVRTQKDYREKVAKPLIDEYQKMMDAISANAPGWKSKRRRSPQDIMEKMKQKMLSRHSARKYLTGLDKAFGIKDGVRAKALKQCLPFYAADYAIKMSFGSWRFNGPIQEECHPDIRRDIRGSNPAEAGITVSKKSAVAIATNWLTGNPETPKFLRDKDEIINGKPVLVTVSSNAGRFRKQLANKLQQADLIIRAYNYSPEIIKSENDRINSWANDFANDEFTPFSTAGNSHIDFAVIPETAELYGSERLVGIRYRIYEHFLGQEQARKTQSLSIPDYVKSVMKPADLIGRKGYSICADMYLDIQVAGLLNHSNFTENIILTNK